MKRMALMLLLLFTAGWLDAQDQPQEIGVFFYRDAASSTWKRLTKSKPIAHRVDLYGRVSRMEFHGFAETRFNLGDKQEFVICGNIDPTRYHLYKFMTDKNKRWLFNDAIRLGKAEIDSTVKKFGSDCYSFAPAEILDRGEYGFSPDGINNAFDFGIGATTQK